MPSPTPPAVRDRALALLASGKSTRAVEEVLRTEGTPLGKSTIAELDRAQRAGKVKRTGAEDAAPDRVKRTGAEDAAPDRVMRTGAEDAAVAVTPTERTASIEDVVDEAAARDVRQLEQTAALFTRRIEEALAETDTRTLATLTPLRLQIGAALARLRPPPRIDPEADPANIAARDELRSRIGRLASDVEASDGTRAAIRAHLDLIERAVSRGAEERAR